MGFESSNDRVGFYVGGLWETLNDSGLDILSLQESASSDFATLRTNGDNRSEFPLRE